MSIDEERFEVNSSATAKSDDLRGFTLIVPCVSIGLVPQLAVDVLLASGVGENEQPEHVCDLDHRFCVPFVGGARPSSKTSSSSSSSSPSSSFSSSPLQVFAFRRARLCVVQQRSPILKARKYDYLNALSQWVRWRAFGEVIVLASLDAGLRTDAQMQHPFWHLSLAITPAASIGANLAATLPSYYTVPTPAPALAIASSSTISSTKKTLPPMPAAGLARRILQSAQHDAWPPTTALLVFAAEGDNRADAIAVAQLLLRCSLGDATTAQPTTSPSTVALVEPSDWRLLFGPRFEPGMF